jgi:RNA polymerase sigma-70 factor (ECF subfamily)
MDAPREASRSSRSEGAETDQIALLSTQFRPALKRFFSKRVKEQHEIDDLVQDVFVRLVRKVNTDGSQILAGYVFQTAQSVLNDWLRKRQVRQASAHEEIETELPDLKDDSTPERVLVGKQSLAKATAAVLELPEVTRTIFLLRRLEGMRYSDIAKRLGMPMSTVEKHMARAVAHLDLRLNGK